MKCKTQVEVKAPREMTLKNKIQAVKGKCPICGTTVFRIIGKKK